MPNTNAGASIEPLTFRPLPLGAIRPSGWLRNQLTIQAAGLSGHLDEFWPDVAESGWIGGEAEGWERGPYWLDGVLPLAFLLGDETLKGKVQRWVDYILEHQHEDGWLGPVHAAEHDEYDPWPCFVALKALTQYHSATGDDRVLPAVIRFLRRLDTVLDEKPLSGWARFRWADLVLSIHWAFDLSGEPWLLDLAGKVRNQGFDWRASFAHFEYTERCGLEELARLCEKYFGTDENTGYFATHVVNNAMAIKTPGVWFRQSGEPGDRDAAGHIIQTLDEYHGQATGVFSGDEHLAGRNPSQGTELCAVVEYMFSLEVLLGILGRADLGDRLERIAFNALPATFKPDMWAHQYDQQANQVVCAVAEDRVYTNNNEDANIFGLEPNFGCCTANMHQGWPKFASSLWFAAGKGLAAVSYAPCTVSARLGDAHVRVEVATHYPFEDHIRFRIHLDVAHKEARFPLMLRIPLWAKDAHLTLDDGTLRTAEPGSFCRVERAWTDNETLTLRLPMHTRLERRFNNSLALERGPLVYALRVGEEWKKVGGETPHADWEVYPTTPWNYAVDLGGEESNGTGESAPEFVEADAAECTAHVKAGKTLFSPETAPVHIKAKGRRLPGWDLEHGAAAPPPQSPVQSGEPLEDLELLPYGCTNLRVTELPVLE